MSYNRNKNKAVESFYHDYETSGADTQRDRPTQFAGIRVDADLKEVSTFNSIYCAMQEDCLPQPMAFLVTRMMVSDVQENGIPEFEFANKVLENFSVPNTTVLGYNTINFDDEITRNMFHRNMINPYDREWRDGNSRWDLINVVRLAAAVFGNKEYDGERIFNIPIRPDGKKSFRLEDLSRENGIEHENAHDALSDVYATIGMAQKIYSKEPEFFKKMESRRTKAGVMEDLTVLDNLKPVLLCSPFFGGEKSYVGFVIPVAKSKSNANEIYCIKLDNSQGVTNILNFSSEEILNLLYEKSDKLKEDGMVRPSLTSIKINACPVYLTTDDIRDIFKDDDSRQEFYKSIGVDREDLADSFKLVRSNFNKLKEKVTEIYGLSTFDNKVVDVDLSIYSGGFPSNDIANLKSRFTSALLGAVDDESKLGVFQEYLELGDDKFKEQVFRIAFRSYPDVAEGLGEEYLIKWNNHCHSRIHEVNEAASINYKDFVAEIARLREDENYQAQEFLSILDDLEGYGEVIADKYNSKI